MRLVEIESSNLKLFEFDYDLTMMIFFLSPDERVYARYGGRDETGPDNRQSLAGLRYTMESVLVEHESASRRSAPAQRGDPFYIRDIAPPRGLGRCIHCHQAKEVIYNRLDRQGAWDIDLAFRYPPPDNLGLLLEVDRGNVIDDVQADSPAANVGLRVGDRIEMLDGVPIHSQGDVMFSLDRAPPTGEIEVVWRRGEGVHHDRMALPAGWRRTNIGWRPSLQNLVAAPRVYGENLTADEKESLGLAPEQLAFRQQDSVHEQAANAGIRTGDVIVGIEDEILKVNAYEFLSYFRGRYVKGETVIVNVIRNGRRLRLPMELQ